MHHEAARKTILIVGLITFVISVVFIIHLAKINKKGGKMTDLTDKKVLLIIASKDFQDQEYQETRRALEERGVEVSVASSVRGLVTGKFGTEVDAEISLDDVDVRNFDGVCFIGGPGAEEYFENRKAHQICQEVVAQDKVLGAICIAPVILAKAGVLEGKKATVWSSEDNREGIEELEKAGANYTGSSVEVDGKIVTASGPPAAYDFGKQIAEVLASSQD